MHHVDIMRVLRGTFIGARVARDETGAHGAAPIERVASSRCRRGNLKIAN